jgi:hypothetical protein
MMTIGIRWIGRAALCALVVLGVQPGAVGAQRLPNEAGSARVEPGLASETSPNHASEGVSAVEALRVSGARHDLLGLQDEVISEYPENDSPLALPQESGGRRGKAFMIAGAAALIGGLIVGGDLGTVIAAGGVVLGAYGVILYF